MLDEISICEVERIKAQIIREMAWDKEEEERDEDVDVDIDRDSSCQSLSDVSPTPAGIEIP